MGYTIFIGSDHAGFALKQYLISVLHDQYEIIDCGAYRLDAQDDYPNFARDVCEKILASDSSDGGRGILICDTGVGMSIAANRFVGIRAALVTTDFMAERSRLHNDANVICLGQDVASEADNERFVRTWLTTDFSAAERHIRRLQAVDSLG